ncbi:MAG: helix-turn-helix domain-containing protein [Dysosmobacter sp.]|jgi:transcriptional regulator with XRE-family HTH domain|uniref:helix-turn-helix domain-containing protein n=1 Tax=Dysosmobacter sp. TaxID=2591382 RepID=UPI003D904289
MEHAKTLGGRIQAFRKAAGLSQEALGEQLGVSRQAVSRWESDAAVPELEKLIAMSRLFGVTVGVLLGVEPPAEDRSTSGQNAAEGKDPDTAPEAEAPVHELTDRELAAVEAIAEKYLAAQQARSSRKWPLVLLAAGMALLLLAGSALWNQLQQIRQELQAVEATTGQQIQSITGQITSILAEQNNIIDDYTAFVEDYDAAAGTMTLTVRVRPAAFSADAQAVFTACTASGERRSAEAVRTEDGYFQAEHWAVPMDGYADLAVTITAGGVSRSEALETLSADPADYRLAAEGGWETSWNAGTVYFSGLTLHIDPHPSVPLELEQVELAVFPNGSAEPLWSSPLPEAAELWRRHGYVQAYLTAKDYMPAIPLGKGDEILAAAKITDDHGQSFWYLLGGARNDDGDLRTTDALALKSACPNWQPGGHVNLR